MTTGAKDYRRTRAQEHKNIGKENDSTTVQELNGTRVLEKKKKIYRQKYYIN